MPPVPVHSASWQGTVTMYEVATPDSGRLKVGGQRRGVAILPSTIGAYRIPAFGEARSLPPGPPSTSTQGAVKPLARALSSIAMWAYVVSVPFLPCRLAAAPTSTWGCCGGRWRTAWGWTPPA